MDHNTYIDKFNASNMLKTMYSFIDEGFYDVTLETHGRQFKAHKLVLCAGSLFFKKMFLSKGFQMNEKNIYNLEAVDPVALQAIIKFLYTSTIEITDDNLFSVVEAVDFLDIPPIRPLIDFYLRYGFGFNVIKIVELAEKFQYNDAAAHAWHKNYTFSFTNYFEMRELRQLYSGQEDQLLRAILDWVLVNFKKREKCFPSLAKELGKLGLKDPLESALKILQDQQHPILLNAGFLEYLMNGSLEVPHFSKAAFDGRAIVAIGGRSDRSDTILGSLECINVCSLLWEINNKWLHSIQLFESQDEPMTLECMQMPRCNYASASTIHDLYIIGGETNDGTSKSCEKFNAATNKWRYLPDLPTPTKDSAAAYCNELLYVSGGVDSSQLLALNPIKDSSWRVISSNPNFSRSQHCMVSALGHLFIIGGVINGEKCATTTVWRFDPRYSLFVEVASMKHARAQFGAVAYFNMIYVMGGRNEDTYLKSAEMYNIIENTWTPMAEMFTPKASFGVAVHNTLFYVFGGMNQSQIMTSCETYNFMAGIWRAESNLNVPRVGLSGAILHFPV